MTGIVHDAGNLGIGLVGFLICIFPGGGIALLNGPADILCHDHIICFGNRFNAVTDCAAYDRRCYYGCDSHIELLIGSFTFF